MSREAHILAIAAADLLVATSRLQTASKEAVYLFFLGFFMSVLAGEDV